MFLLISIKFFNIHSIIDISDRGFRDAFFIYTPVHFLPLLIFKGPMAVLKLSSFVRVLKAAIKSSSFLASFIACAEPGGAVPAGGVPSLLCPVEEVGLGGSGRDHGT